MSEALRPLLPEKEYFTAGEVSRAVQVPVYTLRYWERRFGGLLRPVRRESGHRRYTRREVETLLRIKDLLRNRKMTVAGARKALLERARPNRLPEQTLQGARMNAQALKILRDARDEIRALSEELA
ncbi:MAG: MerR family transcriptional regulator [Elusimicrobiota bacterium]|jgi:DNA-binding transcriptional MerR regulator